jgi:antitoxin ParD1/3/4
MSTSTTTSVNISMPEVVREMMKQRMAAGGYENASEYVRHLIREDLKKAAERKLEQELIDGENSGPPQRVNEEWWRQLRAEIAARRAKDGV